MKHNILSLDFWQDTVIYGSKTFPSGTLGCDALNIPTKVIEQLNDLCIALNLLMGTLNAGCGNPALLPAAKESAKQIADLLKNVKPFSYLDVTDAANRVERVFSEVSLANANAYYAAVQNGTLAAVMKKLAKDKLYRAISNVAYAQGDYEKEMEHSSLMEEAKAHL